MYIIFACVPWKLIRIYIGVHTRWVKRDRRSYLPQFGKRNGESGSLEMKSVSSSREE